MENSKNDIVLNEEQIIRYLKRRYYDNTTRQWSTDIFELRQGEDSISVCRVKYLSSVEEGIKLSFPERMWNTIIAYATLNVKEVRSLSSEILQVDVIPQPTEYNLSHAGITSTADSKIIIGVPMIPAYYHLQGKLFELAQQNIEFRIEQKCL